MAPDGRRFPVSEGETTIGRDSGNDIVIASRQISRQHARIRWERIRPDTPAGRGYTGSTPAATCTVTDLRSTNGTFVNGMPLAPGEATVLKEGDLLGVGPVTLLVTVPSASGEAEITVRLPGATESFEVKPGS